MVKKFAIKQPKPQAAVIGKPQERIVFGFSVSPLLPSNMSQ